jgi:hypothetical protein
MKKLIPLFALPLLLAGCGNNSSSNGSDTNSPAAAEVNTNSAVTPADTNVPAVNTNADMVATNAPTANGSTNTPP